MLLVGGWGGLKASLLGAGLGLLLLLPFVFCGAWARATGSWPELWELLLGPAMLLNLLMGSIFVAGMMALGLVIYKRRVMQTLRNIGRLLASMFTFHMPGGRGFAG